MVAILAVLGTADAVLLEQGALAIKPLPLDETVPVAKKTGPDIPALLAELNLDARLLRESNLLEQVTPVGLAIEYRTLFEDGRLGSIAWIDGAQAKRSFTDLKQKLLQTFSGQLRELVDETTQAPDGPVVNRLSFIDPAISADRFIFLRVRERLYEIHVTPRREASLAGLLKALTTR